MNTGGVKRFKSDFFFEFERSVSRKFFEVTEIDGRKRMKCLACGWDVAVHSTRAFQHVYGVDTDGKPALAEKCLRLAGLEAPQPRINSLISTNSARDALVDCLVRYSIPFSFLDSAEFKRFVSAYAEAASIAAGQPVRLPSAAQAKKIVKQRAVFLNEDRLFGIKNAAVVWGLSLVCDSREFFGKAVVNSYISSPDKIWRLGTAVKNGSIADAKAVADDLVSHISSLQEKVGAHPVTHVILDGTNTNKKAMRLIEMLPDSGGKVFVQVCSAHGFSKLAEKITLLPLFNGIRDGAHEVIKLIKNRDRLRSKLQQTQSSSRPLALFGFCATRFVYVVLALERLYRLQEHICGLLPLLREEQQRAGAANEKEKFQIVIELVSSSEFWDNLLKFVYVLEPVVVAVRFFDAAHPGSVCFVLDSWRYIKQELRRRIMRAFGANEKLLADVDSLVDEYQSKYTGFVHKLAHALEPSNFGTLTMAQILEITDYFKSVPHLVDQCGAFIKLCGAPLPQQWEYEARLFWMTVRNDYPVLSAMAVRVCSGIASSSDCERDFSSMKYIWSALRNRLSVDLVNSLSNLRSASNNAKVPSVELTATKARKLFSATRVFLDRPSEWHIELEQTACAFVAEEVSLLEMPSCADVVEEANVFEDIIEEIVD